MGKDRLKATLAGVGASLAGVVLWVVCAAFLNIIAGIAGALIGLLFIAVYKKINPNDKSAYAIVLGAVLVLIEVIAAELIALAIIAGNLDVSLSSALADADILRAVIIDIAVGLALSYVMFVIYLVAARKRENKAIENNKIYTNINDDGNDNQDNGGNKA